MKSLLFVTVLGDHNGRPVQTAIDARAYSNLQILHNFFEGLGLLVKRGLIDITMVEDLFSQRILWHWENFKPAYLMARNMLNDPTQYDSIEYLYKEMKQRLQR